MRQLYSDQEEVLFDAARPVILNGIEDIVTRSDLADRAMFLRLEPIAEERRRTEAELMAAFEAEWPRILGVLLDAVAEGLRRLPDVTLPKLPRMADFAIWATACERAFWPADTFISAYSGNRDDVVEGMIEADPIATAVQNMMAERTEWTGTATKLLEVLNEMAADRVARSIAWPANPRALSGKLNRAATCLRKIGIDITRQRRGNERARIICITKAVSAPEIGRIGPSASSAPSAPLPIANPINGFAYVGLRTVPVEADDAAGSNGATVRAKPLKTNGVTDADGADAILPSDSAPGNGSMSRWTGRI